MSEERRLVAPAPAARLDRFLSQHYPDVTRSRFQRLIQRGLVTVNGRPGEASQRVRLGDVIGVVIPPPEPSELEPESIPLQVVYHDAHVLVVDKPPGLTVHPAPGHSHGTLVNALLALWPDLKGVGAQGRPGIVHRLDKDTSGLMMVARTPEAHASLARQIKERRVHKAYLALVHGRIARREGEVCAPIARHPVHRKRMAVVPGGREAVTRYRVLREVNGYTFLEAFPTTGRTHQIRVHLASIGHPLMGDALYGRRSPYLARQFLHAHRLGFYLPPQEEEWREFSSELPDDLRAALAAVAGTDPATMSSGG